MKHQNKNSHSNPPSEITTILKSFRKWFIPIAWFSGVINLLALTGSIFMLQVYDRVLSSHSVQTLVLLLLIVVFFYVFQGLLEIIRSRTLIRIGARMNELLNERVFNIFMKLPILRTQASAQGPEPLRDLEKLQTFLSGQAVVALFDLPWIPIYLLFIFFLHPWLGWLTTVAALILIALTIVTDRLSSEPVKNKTVELRKRFSLENALWRNAETIHAMGFGKALMKRWTHTNQLCLNTDLKANNISGALGVCSKLFRSLLQSLVLALAAYLVLRGELSGGSIIASTITAGRALAPIDLAITQWKFFVAARESKKRLDSLVQSLPKEEKTLLLPSPSHEFRVEDISIETPTAKKPLLHQISFSLKAGDGLGIIGPSAAGKSLLVRTLLGLWPLANGSIRLDGATLDQWSPKDLGEHIGYVPQSVELFEGTISETISRFEDNPKDEDIIAAAQAAHVHHLILQLPKGYGTHLSKEGDHLSAGQRQRIALARALYKNPFLVVLDEPNSNLDAEGEEALSRAIMNVRQRGGIVILVAHRPHAIQAVNFLAVMAHGTFQSFGPKEQILQQLREKTPRSPSSNSNESQGSSTAA